MALHILIIDDHALFREALVFLLDHLVGEITVKHAGTASEAIAAVTYYEGLDLIILDRSLSGSDGISLLPELKRLSPETPIVIVSASDRSADVRRAMQSGASGYIPKTVGAQELLYGLGRVLAGETYLSASVLTAMVTGKSSGNQSNHRVMETLTDRQKEVLLLLCRGLSNKGIAKQLKLSEGTVKLHVSAIMRSLGARNRTEAVVIAEQFV